MNILVFNCGSSSLKYRLIEMPSEKELAGGEAQRVGPKTAEPTRIIHRAQGKEEIHLAEMPDHDIAFAEVMKLLARDARLMPDAVGHRVVHGGSKFREHAILDAWTMAALDGLQELAPLHNPPAIALIRSCEKRYPKLPQVLIFDTAFHATIPDYAREYALPQALRHELGIRKYGFHGISHQFVSAEAAKLLGKTPEELNAVSCHLGSGGASLCAIVNGKSVDNTMGYSPLQGLIMSTRSGDLDPAVAMQLLARANGDSDSVERMLNRKSGVLGLSGMSADIRDVLAARDKKDEKSARMEFASQVYLWRIRKYLGAYLAVVGNADAVIFTDTIGELVPAVRWNVCSGMEAFGLKIDSEKNKNTILTPGSGGKSVDVAAQDSAVRILVIATNEEISIARSTYRQLSDSAQGASKGDAA